MPTVKELCIKYGCTKTKEYSQSFAPLYDYFLPKIPNVKNVLEVGVGYPKIMQKYIDESKVPNKVKYQAGASLRVWRDYFPNAEIIGLDIDARAMVHNEKRIQTYLIDTTNKHLMGDLMTGIGKEFDLIIDDGAHHTGGQVNTARNLLPYLKKGGKYFIEDTKNPDRILRELHAWKPVVFDWRVNGEGNDTLVLIET